MADTKISAMTAASALTGAEALPAVQSAANVKTTTQDVAMLAGRFPILDLPMLPTKQVCLIEQAHPRAGNTITLATLTGAGIVRSIQFTVSFADAWKYDRIQVFVDGEVLPSIDVDIGTLHGTAYDGTTNAIVQGTDHITTAPCANNAIGNNWNDSKCWSGALKFPIPYSNGCIIKVLYPTGASNTQGLTFDALFSQITYQPGTLPANLSSLRLKSYGVTNQNAVSYTRAQQITWMNKPNLAGWVAFLALANIGGTPGGGELKYGYLERQEWIAVDGESTTPDGNGAINTSYASSGGEDWFYAGYYFAGQTKINTPDVIVSCASNSNLTSCMSVDFLKRHGGVRFNNQIAMGWSLKDGASGNGFLTAFAGSYQILYYVDTTIPFVPTVPQNASSNPVGPTSAQFVWTRPASDGSDFLTGYHIVLSPGGANTTVAADVNSWTPTGLTTGTTYTATITAINSVGSSTGATATATPAAATVPDAPTIGTATQASSTSVSVTFTPPAFNGGSAITGYTVTPYIAGVAQTGLAQSGASSPIVCTGLTTGTAYTFKAVATNAIGNSAASSASNSVTPSSGTNAFDSSIDAAHVTYSNSNLTIALSANGFWCGSHALNSVSADGTYTVDVTIDSGTVTGYILGVGVCNATGDLTQTPTTANFSTQWFDGTIQGAQGGTGPGFATGDVVGIKLVISGGGATRQVQFRKNGGSYSTAVNAPSGALFYYTAGVTSVHQATASNVTW